MSENKDLTDKIIEVQENIIEILDKAIIKIEALEKRVDTLEGRDIK